MNSQNDKVLDRLGQIGDKEKLIEKVKAVRNWTEIICEPLSLEDHVVQPKEFVSPPKWHLAHTTWFFEEMILKNISSYKVFNPEFSFLFNSYYNSVGERVLRADRGNMTRPELSEVLSYRKYVSDHLCEMIEADRLNLNDLEVLELGLNHEQQHQELLWTDLKFILGHNPVFPVYKKDFSLINDVNSEDGFENIDEGIYNIGYDGKGFCFDNEKKNHKVFVQQFSIEKRLVTNGDFIEFIEDGGYADFVHWLDEGWHWVNEHNVQAPLYWHKINGRWHHYTLNGLQEVEKDKILSHVNFYEAAAFANWKGMRLPTEFEWEVASPKIKHGKRWEWTNSAYLPYPGFDIAPGALGEYNGKFMINQMVLRGGSVASPNGHVRPTYRNFFHPDLRWQFSGIRLVKNE